MNSIFVGRFDQCPTDAPAARARIGRRSCLLWARASAWSTRGSTLHSGWRQTAANSETTSTRERSGIRCSRKENSLILLKYVKCLSTSATSKMSPLRIFSENSLKRSFQSLAGDEKSSANALKSNSHSPDEIGARRPTSAALVTGTKTTELLAARRSV